MIKMNYYNGASPVILLTPSISALHSDMGLGIKQCDGIPFQMNEYLTFHVDHHQKSEAEGGRGGGGGGGGGGVYDVSSSSKRWVVTINEPTIWRCINTPNMTALAAFRSTSEVTTVQLEFR
jgi:hypothetical protein